MADPLEVRWIKCGVVGGVAASVLYPTLLFASLPLSATAAVAVLFGAAIGIGSLGLRQLILLHGQSVSATIGAIANFVAGALFVTMVLVQLAVRSGAWELTPKSPVVGVWLGIDVAWDAYIALGTAFLAWSMLRHPRYGWPFALSGLVVATLVLVLNLVTFPTPPAEAGSIDVGPLVGLWYLAATVQAWRSIAWARAQARRTASEAERNQEPDVRETHAVH